MKKVSYWAFASNNGENLYNSNSFEEALFLEIESHCSYGLNGDEMSLLTKYIDEKSKTLHKQDVVLEIFLKNTEIHFEYATKLNRLDVLKPMFFSAKDEIGKAILTVLNGTELSFILARKTWLSKHNIDLLFEVVYSDYEDQCISRIQEGKYI
jgi:hypothetical protein